MTTYHAPDCDGTACAGCGHIKADGLWYPGPCPPNDAGAQQIRSEDVTPAQRELVREETATGYRYGTPAGWYVLARDGDGWALTTGYDGLGREHGYYLTVPAAEAAIDNDVRERMWA